MSKKHLVILTRIHSEHATLKSAKDVLAKIKLKKEEWGVVITPKGDRHERKK